jgi:GntR family transcriptional regulator/MocR family aminotransferase
MVQSKVASNGRRGANGAGRRIYKLLRDQIADGSLPPGSQVPSTRALASELAVSRTTVTYAYEQLMAEGYLETSPGRVAVVTASTNLPSSAEVTSSERATLSPPPLSDFGRRVAATELPAFTADEPPAFDFLYGAVSSRDFPTRAWRRAYLAELLHMQRNLYYVPPEGDPKLRHELQGYLRRARGLACDADQIVIVHGSQQAIDLCARLLLNPEDAFVFEEPGYLMARRCFEATGARLIATPVDAHGLDTSRLPQDGSARLVYVTPSHQFPLGGVLPIGRRQELLRWAQRHDAWVIEDDYDGEFRYGQRPIDALQSIDTDGRVIYAGTFSKALSPQIRLGYLVLPHRLVHVFRQAKRLTDRHAPLLEQKTLASMIESGSYERHVRRMRREYERRRAALLEAISQHLPAGAQVSGTAAGLHVALWLPDFLPQDEIALVAAARSMGVGVYPVTPLFAEPQKHPYPRPAGLILGYASLLPERIRQGVLALAPVLRATNLRR